MLRRHIPSPIKKLLRPLKRRLSTYLAPAAKPVEAPSLALLLALPQYESAASAMLHSLKAAVPKNLTVELVIACCKAELRDRRIEVEAALAGDVRITVKYVALRDRVSGSELLRAAADKSHANWTLIVQPRTRFTDGYFQLVYRDLARLPDVRAIQTMPQIYREAIHLTLNHPMNKYMLPNLRSVTKIEAYAKNARPTTDGLWLRRLDLRAALAHTQSKTTQLPLGETLFHWLKLPGFSKVILLPEAEIVSNSRDNLESLGSARQLSVASLERTVEAAAQEIEIYLAREDPLGTQLALFRMVEAIKFLTAEVVVEDDLSEAHVESIFQRLRRAGRGMGLEWLSSLRLAGLTQDMRVAILALIHDAPLAERSVNLRAIDPAGAMVQFSFIRNHNETELPLVFCNSIPRALEFISAKRLRFLGRPFVEETHFWIRIADKEKVTFRFKDMTLMVRRGGKAINQTPTIEQLTKVLAPPAVAEQSLTSLQQAARAWALSSRSKEKYNHCWLLLDRIDKADDNAEHFYRFLIREGKAARAFFILDPSSPDWSRLQAENFQLIAHGSSEHIAALAHADMVLSSHTSNAAIRPTRANAVADHLNYRFVFLQHGVIQNEMSAWLNRVRIDLFVTSTEEEKASIADASTDYVFSDKEVVLTGLPRHDALVENVTNNVKRDAIVITPTWRRSLLDTSDNSEQAARRLLDSPFWRNWSAYLKSAKLLELARTKDLQILFVPHPNMAPRLKQLDIPAHIRVFNPMTDGSYQDIFRRAALGVTDYSSTATEIAYSNAPVLYFQFDHDEVYGGGHTFKKGYFDHKNNGFGPVCITAEDLLRQTDSILTTGPEAIYLKRLDSTFLSRDGRCCQRVYEAILALHAPVEVTATHQSDDESSPNPRPDIASILSKI